jgi:hypothetical protein
LVFAAWNLRFPAKHGGMSFAKSAHMIPTTDFFGQSQFRTAAPGFWERIINDEALNHCDSLEKLLAGCELIAAVDHVDLLLAA